MRNTMAFLATSGDMVTQAPKSVAIVNAERLEHLAVQPGCSEEMAEYYRQETEQLRKLAKDETAPGCSPETFH
jgi:hypothetical protein